MEYRKLPHGEEQISIIGLGNSSLTSQVGEKEIQATVEMALESIDATLNDHIIFAGDDYHSFAKSGWLWTAKREVRRQRQEELQASREEEREILRRGGLL